MQILAQVKQRGKEKGRKEGGREVENKAGRGRVLDCRSVLRKVQQICWGTFTPG